MCPGHPRDPEEDMEQMRYLSEQIRKRAARKKAKKRYFKMSSERVMQEICTVTALGENALTSISYAKVALQMAETQNGCRKIGLGYSGNNVQCHLWINTETYLANAEESVTKFFRYLKCCFLPEIVKVGYEIIFSKGMSASFFKGYSRAK